jgi:hypothetical protein
MALGARIGRADDGDRAGRIRRDRPDVKGRHDRAEIRHMRALVVYESMFGNTEAIALAIADGLRDHLDADAIEVGAAPMTLPLDVSLLIVGGPTHLHGLTSARSRADAAKRAGDRLVSRGSGIREWLETLAPAPATISGAAFDTRNSGPALLVGSAAKGATKRLRSLGYRVVPPVSFVVAGPASDLFARMTAAELDRARTWGRSLGQAVGSRAKVLAR